MSGTTNNANNRDLTAAELVNTLDAWSKRCIDARNGHYTRAEKLFYRSHFLGYVLICATVFVTAFSFYSSDPSKIVFWNITKQHIIVLMGCVSAVISGIVTQARHGERGEIHRATGAQYANLARKLESIKLEFSTEAIDYTEAAKQSKNVIDEWNGLAKDSPLTPHGEDWLKLSLIFLIPIIFIGLFFAVASCTSSPKTSVPQPVCCVAPPQPPLLCSPPTD